MNNISILVIRELANRRKQAEPVSYIVLASKPMTL